MGWNLALPDAFYLRIRDMAERTGQIAGMEETVMQQADHTHETIRASRVNGTEVYNMQGDHLGQIEDIVLNKADGKAQYAIMSFGGILGIGADHHPIPWDKLTYDTAKGGYVSDIDKAQLENAPSFAAEADEPDWTDPEYHRRIYGFYGVPPYL